MAGHYPNRIEELTLYDGRFDAYKLEAKESNVLFASYPAGTSIPPHTHETGNCGVITRGELILTMTNETTKYGVHHHPAGVVIPVGRRVVDGQLDFVTVGVD